MQKMVKMTQKGLVVGYVKPVKPKKVEEEKVVEESVEAEEKPKPKRTYNKKK